MSTFASFSKLGETIKSKLGKSLDGIARRVELVQHRHRHRATGKNRGRGGIKASRVILDSNRGGVHRGAPTVTGIDGRVLQLRPAVAVLFVGGKNNDVDAALVLAQATMESDGNITRTVLHPGLFPWG